MKVADITAIAALAGKGGGSPSPTPASAPYDFIIKVDGSTSSFTNWALEYGDWEATAQKIEEGKFVNGYIYYYNISGAIVGQAYTFLSAEYHSDAPEIALFLITPTQPTADLVVIYWMPDNTIEKD